MITAIMVQELRDKTDAPLMQCKMCLVMCEGNMERAEEMIRTGGSKVPDTMVIMDLAIRVRELEKLVRAQSNRISYLETQTQIYGRT